MSILLFQYKAGQNTHLSLFFNNFPFRLFHRHAVGLILSPFFKTQSKDCPNKLKTHRSDRYLERRPLRQCSEPGRGGLCPFNQQQPNSASNPPLPRQCFLAGDSEASLAWKGDHQEMQKAFCVAGVGLDRFFSHNGSSRKQMSGLFWQLHPDTITQLSLPST